MPDHSVAVGMPSGALEPFFSGADPGPDESGRSRVPGARDPRMDAATDSVQAARRMGDLGHRGERFRDVRRIALAMMLVARSTPAATPWIDPAACAVLLIVGLALSLERRASQASSVCQTIRGIATAARERSDRLRSSPLQFLSVVFCSDHPCPTSRNRSKSRAFTRPDDPSLDTASSSCQLAHRCRALPSTSFTAASSLDQ